MKDQYIMWFATGPFYKTVINIAVSEDGSSWEKYPNNPVLTPGPAFWQIVLKISLKCGMGERDQKIK